NREMIERILELKRELGARVDQSPPRIESLLAIRGVLESGDSEEPAALDAETEAALLASLGQAVEALVAMRATEGRRLAGLLAAQVDAIEGLTREALALASPRRRRCWRPAATRPRSSTG